MILDQLFEAAGADSMAQQVAQMLRQTHPNPSEATEREILAATGRVLSDQGMSDVQVRFYLRDPDFQSDIIEEVQARLQGVAEMDSQGYRGHRGDEDPGKGPEKSVRPAKTKDVAKDTEKELTKAMDKAHKKQGVGEAMKPSDIPPTMRQRLTMRDVEAERPQGAFRFRVTYPDGSHRDFMDFAAARSSADTEKGRLSRINEGLRDGEYHVATVTLDDGTVKRVPVTTDEGFRELVQKYFARQGRQVKDIQMDHIVQTEAAKKKPQPTNPELWSRAKSAARSKFDVYPSAYANAWAAKWYKSKGGGWRMGNPKKD
jgi:SOS response regulatory protein OraA/RecX